MIIVNQNKDNIINFNNVTSIWTEEDIFNEANAEFGVYADGEIMGYYKTVERAKEVLKDIIYQYEHCEALKCNKHLEMQDIMKKDFTYEMPLE